MQVARLLDKEIDAQRLRQAQSDPDGAGAGEAALAKTRSSNLYLVLAPYGGNIEGIRAASLAYLGKEPRRLTPAEAALLVALPQSPEARRPDRNNAAARAARDRVLERAAEAGVLTADDVAAARSEPVPDVRHPFPMLAPHTAERDRRGFARRRRLSRHHRRRASGRGFSRSRRSALRRSPIPSPSPSSSPTTGAARSSPRSARPGSSTSAATASST